MQEMRSDGGTTIRWRWGVTIEDSTIHIFPGMASKSFCGHENLPEVEAVSENVEICGRCVYALMTFLGMSMEEYEAFESEYMRWEKQSEDEEKEEKPEDGESDGGGETKA